MRYTVLALALLSLLLPLSAHAQAPLPIAPGDSVRLSDRAQGSYVFDARLLRTGPTGIEVAVGGDQQVKSLDWTMIEQISVRKPVTRGQRVRKAVAWGVYLGASIGGIAGPLAAQGIAGGQGPWQSAGLGLGAGALVGAATGALVGLALPAPTWRWEHYRFKLAR